MNVRKQNVGFTLVEAIFATAIVGLGVGAILASAAAQTRINDAGMRLTQATFLAQALTEWTLRLPFSDPDESEKDNPPGPDGLNPQLFVDDLDDFLGFDLTGVTYSPPRDGQGMVIANMPGWSQHIDLTWRNPGHLTEVVSDGTGDVVYVEAIISLRGEEVLKTDWLVTKKE